MRWVANVPVSEGSANGLEGHGRLSFRAPVSGACDILVYDPGTPVPSLGGHACCSGTDTASGAYEQTRIKRREDVLVHTSPALDAGMEVTGPLVLIPYGSSSAPDADFTARRVDVYPDGRAFNVQEGAVRMRYREGFDGWTRREPPPATARGTACEPAGRSRTLLALAVLPL